MAVYFLVQDAAVKEQEKGQEQPYSYHSSCHTTVDASRQDPTDSLGNKALF
jgi:hypothetical protein